MKFKNYYFCSKFFVHNETNWYRVPDPLKLISKLVRKDLVNFEHAEQHHISLIDLLKPFSDARLNDLLSVAVNERYPSKFSDLSP